MNLPEQLLQLQQQLQSLLQVHQSLKNENTVLKRKVHELQQALDSKAEALAKLQASAQVAQLGVQQWDEAEKQALEKKINQYLKEIDKCLSLLNS